MARSRNIKHGLYLNEELAELSIYARYLFPCLWCLADKNGRMEYRPRKIKAEAYPYDDVDIPALLVELHEKQFISVYGHGTRAYIQISRWEKHQNPHPKEKASEIPPITDDASIIATIGFSDSHEKKFLFSESNGPAEKFNLIPDVRIPDSNPSDSNPSSPDAKPVRMKREEFASLYYRAMGKQMSGMLNHDCDDICAKYDPDKVRESFRIAAENGATSFNYVQKILKGEKPNGRQGTSGSSAPAGRKAGGIIEANTPDADWLGA